MAIKDPFLVEEENLPAPSEPPALAVVGSVDYDNGVTLIFPGAQGESAKYYKCNSTIKLTPGQRVRIEKISGSFVVAYPIGVPAQKIVADSADAIGGYTVATDSEGALIFRDADATQVPVALAALANEAAHALAADTAQDAVTLGGKEEADLEVARAAEADTAETAQSAETATEAETAVSGAGSRFYFDQSHNTYAEASGSTSLKIYCGSSQNVELNQWNGSWYWHSDAPCYLGGAENRWTTVYLVNQPNVGSDKNSKKSITDKLEKYLAMHKLLRPVSYMLRNLKKTDAHDRKHIGFIAQEVEAAMGQAGLSAEDFGGLCVDNGKYSLRYGEFVALNTAAIHALEKRVEALEQTITEMEAANGRTKPDVRQ